MSAEMDVNSLLVLSAAPLLRRAGEGEGEGKVIRQHGAVGGREKGKCLDIAEQ